MELCSLEDAFPNIDTGSVHKGLTSADSSGFPYVGGTDSKASREERRAARKRAKKLKGPTLAYSESITPPTAVEPDPDRPAVKRMEPVPSTQGEKDGFAIPILPKASCLFSDAGTPAYFGKDQDDEEGFSSFSPVGGDNPNFMLQADVSKTFDLKGVGKAGGMLPEPNLEDVWKPMSPAASYTAFVPEGGKKEAQPWSMNVEHKGANVSSKRTIPEGEPASVSGDSGDRDVLLGRINELVTRLETLEKKKSQDSQTEILMFVGTGAFLILSFELLTRR
jgi:hypothetical protein